MGEPEIHAIRITTSHCLGGGRGDVAEGTVLAVPSDVSLAEAMRKIAMSFAVAIPGEERVNEEPMPEGAPAAVEVRDPAGESRDPAMSTATAPAQPTKPKRKGKQHKR